MCHRKGAATAAARLSFLSPSSVAIPVPGYPNFTPESQYLLITLEGIVLYSLRFPSLTRSLCLPRLRRPSRAISLHVSLRRRAAQPAALLSTRLLRKRETDGSPVALSSRSQLFLAILAPCFAGGKSSCHPRVREGSPSSRGGSAMKIHPTNPYSWKIASRVAGECRRTGPNSRKLEGHTRGICARARLAPYKSTSDTRELRLEFEQPRNFGILFKHHQRCSALETEPLHRLESTTRRSRSIRTDFDRLPMGPREVPTISIVAARRAVSNRPGESSSLRSSSNP